MLLSDINIRDPFILPWEGAYYLYGSRVANPAVNATWGMQAGFDVYKSTDLTHWDGPKSVFEITGDFWATRDAWAPEVHLYRGKFYMFASFKAEDKCRGTHILVADRPDGVFVPVSDSPATPTDWECLDGTLYIAQNGDPYIVFCHEWLQVGNGTVCAQKLCPDLTASVGEPLELWSAKDYPGVVGVRGGTGFVTDGPFLYRCADGTLLSIWSTFGSGGYAELICKSAGGEIDGPWQVCSQPLFENDGGHGMIFRDFTGRLLFIMHRPNSPATTERPVLLQLVDTGSSIRIL